MIYIKANELYHHGIKGQRWGIRRFQNSDGSLTSAGRARYNRGKELSKEYGKVKGGEYERLTKRSKVYKANVEEMQRVAERYGLDAYGDGGYSSRYSEEVLRRAKDRYFEYSENVRSLQDQFEKSAKEFADRKMLEKYGDTAISDINYYNGVNTAIFVSAFLLTSGAFALIAKNA